ncbi:MAG: aminopeptidase [Ignavibacteria bacterium]|nr:aminopeptidase [Ignavibacteria bacterium]
MEDKLLKKYYDVIIQSALNLYEGQSLFIGCGVKNYDFGIKLAEAAYQYGLKYVDVMFGSDYVKKARIDNNRNNEFLEFIPNYMLTRSYEMLSNDWAMLKIDNVDEIDVLKGIDPTKMEVLSKKEFSTFTRQSQSTVGFHHQWCIVTPPGKNWAKLVTGIENEDEAIKKLEESLIKILRLDTEDPVKAWKDHADKLSVRAKILSELNLDKLHFETDGTDLIIGLNNEALWKGGYGKANNGRNFIPNLPTEEIFSTPDFTRTSGKAKVTKPVKVLETQLNGIWFEFKDGRVINYGCDNNKEILDKFFSIDEGAKYLGEVALVDKSSKIFESGLIFNNILYDENAACHIALGRGFSALIKDGNKLTTPELLKKGGCNFSLVHTDFMIGSRDINVTGYDRKGNTVKIIENGSFVIG